MSRQSTLGINAAHHHPGVLPSMTPAIVSESHPSPRLFSTNGMRTNSGGGGARISFCAGRFAGTFSTSGLGGVRVVMVLAIMLSFHSFVRRRSMPFAVIFKWIAILFDEILRAKRHLRVVRHLRVGIAHPGK